MSRVRIGGAGGRQKKFIYTVSYAAENTVHFSDVP